ncbi:MAG: hypothetical protein R2813_10245 [Flavobacteriales bacterium]
MISEHHIEIRKSARYFVLEPEKETVAILYAIHGYRQLGQYFTKQFQALADLGVKVVAPEGLHRFYIEGYSGRVGASWMTKEDRLTDIKDYVGYLNQLHHQLSPSFGNLPIHLLGFSQGGPTACRWLAGSEVDFASLMLYATVFPNDFDFDANQSRMKSIPTTIAFGDSDQFAPEETIAEKMNWLSMKGMNANLIRFRGGHEIFADVLCQWWQSIQND